SLGGLDDLAGDVVHDEVVVSGARQVDCRRRLERHADAGVDRVDDLGRLTVGRGQDVAVLGDRCDDHVVDAVDGDAVGRHLVGEPGGAAGRPSAAGQRPQGRSAGLYELVDGEAVDVPGEPAAVLRQQVALVLADGRADRRGERDGDRLVL